MVIALVQRWVEFYVVSVSEFNLIWHGHMSGLPSGNRGWLNHRIVEITVISYCRLINEHTDATLPQFVLTSSASDGVSRVVLFNKTSTRLPEKNLNFQLSVSQCRTQFSVFKMLVTPFQSFRFDWWIHIGSEWLSYQLFNIKQHKIPTLRRFNLKWENNEDVIHKIFQFNCWH